MLKRDANEKEVKRDSWLGHKRDCPSIENKYRWCKRIFYRQSKSVIYFRAETYSWSSKKVLLHPVKAPVLIQ